MAEDLGSYSGRRQGRAGKRVSIFLYLVVAGIVLLVVVASFAAMNEQQRAAGGQALPAGASALSGGSGRSAQAPDFTYTPFDGKELTLSSLRGKPVVLNFWASWCPPCREEAAELQKVYEAFKEKGVVFLGVDVQDTEQNGRAFLKEFGVTYPNGQDVTGKITTSYGLTGVPETFLITRDGNIVQHLIGPVAEEQLSELIQQLILP